MHQMSCKFHERWNDTLELSGDQLDQECSEGQIFLLIDRRSVMESGLTPWQRSSYGPPLDRGVVALPDASSSSKK